MPVVSQIAYPENCATEDEPEYYKQAAAAVALSLPTGGHVSWGSLVMALKGVPGMVAMRETTNRKRDRDDQDRDRPRRPREDQDDGQQDTGMVSGALKYVKDGARAAGEQIQRTLGDTTEAVLDTVLDEAERIYEQQRKNAISRVSGLSKIAARSAHALHAVKAEGVAEYVEEAAKQVERSTEYLQDRELTEILEDAGEVIRRNRGAAMAAMFVVGFAATRFLKASATRAGGNGAAGGGGGGQGRPERAMQQKRRQRQ